MWGYRVVNAVKKQLSSGLTRLSVGNSDVSGEGNKGKIDKKSSRQRTAVLIWQLMDGLIRWVTRPPEPRRIWRKLKIELRLNCRSTLRQDLPSLRQPYQKSTRTKARSFVVGLSPMLPSCNRAQAICGTCAFISIHLLFLQCPEDDYGQVFM